jgi:lipoprotein-anchoring transpeptidase ErfK/SrfK
MRLKKTNYLILPAKQRQFIWQKRLLAVLFFIAIIGLIHCTTHKRQQTATPPTQTTDTLLAIPLPTAAQASALPQATTIQVTMATSPPQIKIDISEQTLYLSQGNESIATYPISTSKFGIGSQAGSNKTPLGRHYIAQKIGEGAPEGTVFKARVNTGRIAKINREGGDIVSSRIMWLKGLEAGKNLGVGVDSYRRYIYIHGTAEENKIGQPASHGCIRMYNRDVIDLFDRIEEGTKVNIIE